MRQSGGLSEFPLGDRASIFPLKTSGQAYGGGDGSGKIAAALLDQGESQGIPSMTP